MALSVLSVHQCVTSCLCLQPPSGKLLLDFLSPLPPWGFSLAPLLLSLPPLTCTIANPSLLNMGATVCPMDPVTHSAFSSESGVSTSTSTIWFFLNSLPGSLLLTWVNHLFSMFCFLCFYLVLPSTQFVDPTNSLAEECVSVSFVLQSLHVFVFLHHPSEGEGVEMIIGSIFKVAKWRLREGKSLLQGSPAHKGQR